MSNVYLSDNTVDLNNTIPSISVSSVGYPNEQQALKNNESAVIDVVLENTDILETSSSDFNTTLNGNIITANLNSNAQSKNSSSLEIIATKSSNQATTTISQSIKIAHKPTEWESVPNEQIRTDIDQTTKSIDLYFNEDILEITLDSIEEVSFDGLVKDTPKHWKLNVNVSDENIHQSSNYAFTIQTYNLARRSNLLDGYFQIKGFFERSYQLNTNQTLELTLGVTVVDETNLVVSSNSPPFNYSLVNEFSQSGSESEFKYLGSNTLEFSSSLKSFLTGNNPPGTVEIQVEEI